MDFLTLLILIPVSALFIIILHGAWLIVQDKEREFHQRKATKHKE